MTCAESRAQLPLFLYGDLPDETAGAVRDHLAGCAACRRVQQGLAQTRELLDELPAPGVSVDLAALYRRLAQEHQQQTRRWRRATWAAVGLAACLLIGIMLTRCEIHLGGGQLVFRWGPPEPVATAR